MLLMKNKEDSGSEAGMINNGKMLLFIKKLNRNLQYAFFAHCFSGRFLSSPLSELLQFLQQLTFVPADPSDGYS